MNFRPVLSLLFLAALLTAAAISFSAQVPPSPEHYLTDSAGVLSQQQRDSIDARLEKYAGDTGHQIVVWIGDTTGGGPIDEWALAAFNQWKIGRKEVNDGVLLVIMTQDHTTRITVGSGIEGIITDAVALQIIDQRIIPNMRSGNPGNAVSSAIDGLILAFGGQAPTVNTTPTTVHTEPVNVRTAANNFHTSPINNPMPQTYYRPQPSFESLIPFLIPVIVVVAILGGIVNRGRRGGRGMWMGNGTNGWNSYDHNYYNTMGGGGFTGGGFSGGDSGFSGGGGSSSGGGASGSW